MQHFFTPLRVFTIILSALALLAPFFFPWPFALGIGILASIFFPPVVILTGTFIDVLYFSSKVFPYFTILGFVLSLISYFVHHFIKTRIIS
jgi:hypothetical protein